MTWTTPARPGPRCRSRGRVGHVLAGPPRPVRASVLRPVLVPTAVVALLLSGCDGSKKSADPAASASPGVGRATLSLDAHNYSFTVRCTNSGGVKRASGSSGAAAFNVALTGSPLSAVLVLTATDGSRVINQAIDDLRDDQGQAVGRIAVNADGSNFTGSGTFVHTSIDATGKRIVTATPASAGTFTVACPAGFA